MIAVSALMTSPLTRPVWVPCVCAEVASRSQTLAVQSADPVTANLHSNGIVSALSCYTAAAGEVILGDDFTGKPCLGGTAIYPLPRQSRSDRGTNLPRRVRTTDLTSPEWPSSTFKQLPLTMSHTTASSSPEAVMALLPQFAIAPSVSQPPCPANTPTF